MSFRPEFIPYGDGAVLLRFQAEGYSREVIDSIHTLRRELLRFDVWEDLVPGYDSLLVVFNPVRLSSGMALSHIEAALETLARAGASPSTSYRRVLPLMSAKTMVRRVVLGAIREPRGFLARMIDS